jgi:hypothetical protein
MIGCVLMVMCVCVHMCVPACVHVCVCVCRFVVSGDGSIGCVLKHGVLCLAGCARAG